MSSKLIRRLATIAVATVIPFGAAASSAHADTSSPDPQISVGTAAPSYTPYEFWRSSWS